MGDDRKVRISVIQNALAIQGSFLLVPAAFLDEGFAPDVVSETLLRSLTVLLNGIVLSDTEVKLPTQGKRMGLLCL
jgi:hypothetical protein